MKAVSSSNLHGTWAEPPGTGASVVRMVGPSTSRRSFLGASLGATVAAALSSCAPTGDPKSVAPTTTPTGPVAQTISLRAQETQIDLGGRVATAWTFGQQVPGREIRATVGQRVRITVSNDLPEETSVHWHGLAIPNPMDGVPGVTTPAIQPGTEFTYDFIVPDAGTHWFHPHTGLQLDTGLYAPFIVEDANEAGGYDHDWVVMLDDWTQGVGDDPEQIFDGLVAAGQRSDQGGMMHMGGMGMGADGGDVTYPLYLINGRSSVDPDTLRAKRGDRVRIRIINVGADTIFTFAVAGHTMTITHTDGFPVQPVDALALRIGMGERYDVIVKVGDGVFPVVAEPAGRNGYALAVIRSATGSLPTDLRPSELSAYPASAEILQADPSVRLPREEPRTSYDLVFSGSMAPYVWTINGVTYNQAQPLTVQPGEPVRLRLSNMSMMSHPIHLHGHTFQLGSAGGTGARKDTLLLPPMARAEVALVADNPGRWMLHCHNAYHSEAGMMTRLDYTT